MATTETKIVISAEDRTKAAFLAVQNSLAKMTRSIAVLAGAGSLGAMFKSIVDGADELAKLNERTGVSVEKLSEFAYGAKLAGVGTAEMTSGLQKLAQAMAEATANRGSQAAEVFRTLGISASDSNGRLRDTGKVFEELSGKFAGFADGANKVAIARALLGKSGDSLIPMMNQLAQSSEEARRLGVTISDDFAKRAEAFNDHMTRMKSVLTSFGREAIAPVIGGFNAMFAAMEAGDRKRLSFLEDEAAEIKKRMGSETGAKYLGTFYSDSQFNEDIERLREIEAETTGIRARLAKPIQPPSMSGKPSAPGILDVAQVTKFESVLADLATSTSKAQLALVTDEQDKANLRISIAMAEAMKKADFEKMSLEQRKRYIEAFSEFAAAKTAEEMEKAKTPMQKLNTEWQNTSKLMQDATAKWATGATEALTDFVMTGKASFTDFTNSVIRDLTRMYIQKQITGPLFSSMESGGVFSAIASFFGGARAAGGPVDAGMTYLVGERGPELFQPSISGRIVSNDRLGRQDSGGDTYNYHYYTIDARNADAPAIQHLEGVIRELNGSIERRAIGAVVDAKRRGMMPT